MRTKSMHYMMRPVLFAATLVAAQFSGAQVVTNWIAYNDHVPGTTAPNVNRYNLRGTPGTPPEPVEGFLTNFTDGSVTPAYIIATATGSPDYFGTMAAPNAGTPAYNLFNGLVDVGNVNSGIGIRSSANTTTTLTFSNLNPSQRYIFRGTSVRGGSYLRRWTLASLMGADSFVNAHTAGVFTRDNFPTGTMTNGQAAYDSGENREGELVGWNEINPGADGVFSIKCEQYIDNPLPNGQTPDLAAYGYAFCAIYLVEVGSPTPAVITANPPANVTLEQNRPLILSANAQGAPAPAFQWYKDNAPIAGATSRTYSVPSAQTGDSGAYYLVASNPQNQATSTVAQVVVFADTNGPVLLSVKTDDTFQRIFLTWNEAITHDPAIEFGSYIINDPSGSQVFVTGVEHVGSNVVLSVAPGILLTDTNYSIELDYQTDLVGNPTKTVGTPTGDPNGIATNFHTFNITRGFTRFQAYLNLPAGETIAQFVAMPVYPNSPTFSFYTNILNWPQTAPVNIEQYVMRFTGLFIAPETGTHRFDPAHDDEMRLRVYPGSDPSGTPAELGAACCTALTGGPTLDVDMVAGQAYYYELIVREFGGGDYAGIGVTLPSGANIAPIDAQFLAIAASPAGASVSITQQPANTFFNGNPGVGLLSQDFNAGDGGFTVTTPQPYDGPWVYNSGTGSWQQNGQGPENNHPNTSLLDSPPLNVTASGEVVLSFDHRYSFEQDTTSWDGGQVRVSRNGGPFIAVPAGSFTSNTYNGSVGGGSTAQLAGQPAFVGNSPGFVFITSVANLGSFNAGDVIRVEFMAASDGNTAGTQSPNWEITSVQLIQGATVSVTFSVRASGVTAESTNPPQSYQWFRNGGTGFVPIPGATGADYRFSPNPSDNGAQYRATVSVPGASTTSSPATLTFGVAGPRLGVRRSGGNLIITWPGSFTTFTLETAAAIPSATWTSVSSTVVNGENTAVIPIPATGSGFYRLRR